VWYRLRIGTAYPAWIWEDTVMRLSSSFVAPSAVAILSTALLCGLSATAVSQTATGSATWSERRLPDFAAASP
jgi:hypothetical protein